MSPRHLLTHLRVIKAFVLRGGFEFEQLLALAVEDARLGGHEAEHDAELVGRGAPRSVVDRPLLR